MSVPLLEAWQDWECKACGLEQRTRPQPPNASRFHPCPKLHGLTAPMVRAGTDCTVVAIERGDYLRTAEQRTGDDGKPYMAVETRYADGRNDTAAFAEVAIARFGGQRA
jgi:hypothetical protein